MKLPKIISQNKVIFAGMAGLLLGVLIILAIRLFSYKPATVHYHANFAVYINGQREQFKSPSYYEEESAVGSCTVDTKTTPMQRVHMHDNVNSVIHVHDHAVTWQDFFTNLGWTVDSSLIQARTKVYLVNKNHPVTFILNGKPVTDISALVINDLDRLLVSYGKESKSIINKEYKSVPATAKQVDAEKDPASCGGSAPATTSARFHHLF